VLTAGDRALGFVLPGTTGDAVESYTLGGYHIYREKRGQLRGRTLARNRRDCSHSNFDA
jgi:hypothetical protein